RVLDESCRAQPVAQPVALPEALPEAPGREPVLRALAAAVQRALREDENEEFVLEGASHILGQPEFRDVNKVEPIIRLLEQRKSASGTRPRLRREASMRWATGAETRARRCTSAAWSRRATVWGAGCRGGSVCSAPRACRTSARCPPWRWRPAPSRRRSPV